MTGGSGLCINSNHDSNRTSVLISGVRCLRRARCRFAAFCFSSHNHQTSSTSVSRIVFGRSGATRHHCIHRVAPAELQILDLAYVEDRDDGACVNSRGLGSSISDWFDVRPRKQLLLTFISVDTLVDTSCHIVVRTVKTNSSRLFRLPVHRN